MFACFDHHKLLAIARANQSSWARPGDEAYSKVNPFGGLIPSQAYPLAVTSVTTDV